MTRECECRCHTAKTPYVCFCGGFHNDPKPARDPERNARGVEACREAVERARAALAISRTAEEKHHAAE